MESSVLSNSDNETPAFIAASAENRRSQQADITLEKIPIKSVALV